MDIHTQYSTPITNNGTNIKLEKSNDVNSFASIEEKKNAEYVVNENPEIWEELREEYDVRNSSFDELCDMSMRLYLAGQITLFEHAVLIFDPSKFSQPAGFNFCLTEANTEGKRDWIAEYEARAARDFKLGNMLGYKVKKNILGILERLQSME